MSSRRPYKLDRVAIRMVKEPPLYSSEPLRSPEAAVKVIGEARQDPKHRSPQGSEESFKDFQPVKYEDLLMYAMRDTLP